MSPDLVDAGRVEILAVADLAPEAISATSTSAGVILRADELTLHIQAGEAEWQVRRQWRDQDRGVAFQAKTSDDVVRYVVSCVANDIRKAHHLTALRRPLSIDEDGVAIPLDGFSLTAIGKEGFVLSRGTPDSEHFFASDLDAAKFSYFADQDLESLRTLLLSGA